MGMFQPVSVASDRVMATLIAGLEIEFGRGAGEGLAQHFLNAEGVDYRWDARASEHWLGSYDGADDDESCSIGWRFAGGWTGNGSRQRCSWMATEKRMACSDVGHFGVKDGRAKR